MDLGARGSAGRAEPRPVRIVRIITRLNIGGPSVHAILLSQRLRDGYQTLLVTGTPDVSEGDMGAELDRTGVRCVRVSSLRRPLNVWADLRAWWRIFRIIRRERPDIVHTHMAKAGALGRTAAMAHNWLARFGARVTGRPSSTCRIIHTFHGHVLDGYFSPRLSQVFVMIERSLARGTDRLIAVSRIVRNELLQLGIGIPAQWNVIPLGLDLSSLEALPPPNGSSVFRIGMVGRLVPIKNPGLFLRGLEQAARPPLAVPISGVIVGDGPERLTLEQEAKRLGLETLVQFTGWQRDLPDVYGRLDAACLTSWNEGTPVALIEAMAAGRVVVATDVGGVRDLLDEAEGPSPAIPAGGFRMTARGMLVQPGDAAGLAAALQAVAADGNLRRRLGAAARTFVVQRFSAERLCRNMKALYADLTERPAGRSE